MNMGCNFRLAPLLVVLLSIPAPAQDPGRPLAWEDCVAIALKNNSDLASSLSAMQASKSGYYGSFSGLMPQLNLSNSYTKSNTQAGFSSLGAVNHWQTQGALSLNIWNAGQIASIKTASAALTQAEANLRQASAILRFNLLQAFAQLLYAQKNADVSRMILDMRQKSAQLVTLRYDSGQESKGNMLRSKAQAFQAQADLAQSLRSLRTAQKALDRQLGLDVFTVVAATGALEASAPPDLPNDMAPLLAARPDIAIQQAVIQGVEASLSQARSTLWPSLSVSYTRTALGPDEFPPARQYNWSYGGLLSYSLFGGGPSATYFAVSAAKKNLRKSEQDFRTVKNQAIVDLETSWSNFSGAVDQVNVQAALLEAARQRNDEADVRYASGLLTYDNWEIIASDRINQERQAIQAKLSAVNNEAVWQKALGKILGE